MMRKDMVSLVVSEKCGGDLRKIASPRVRYSEPLGLSGKILGVRCTAPRGL
jgi:hypothetical protein